MAGFHPETMRRLRRELRDVTKQCEADAKRLSKLRVSSKSLMAQQLSKRIKTNVAVAANYERLLAFAEGVNSLYTDHELGVHDEQPHSHCDRCQAADTESGETR